MTMHTSHGYNHGTSSPEARRVPRTQAYCVSVLSVGALATLGVFLGVFSSLSMAAWILLLAASVLVMIAGIVAEKDRRAGRVPAGVMGGGAPEHSLTWFFLLAVVLVIGAIWIGSAQ